jgi:hypothetical protein
MNFLQLVTSDLLLSIELLALFSIGFYLLLAITSFPKRASLSGPLGSKLSRTIKIKQIGAERQLASKSFPVGFAFCTIVGVGSVISPRALR